MQIIKFILIFVLLFPLKKVETSLFFFEARLVYYNDNFFLNFKKINRFFKYFNVEVNSISSMKLTNIYSIESIVLPFLNIDKENLVKISYQDNFESKVIYFKINLSKQIDITSDGRFYFNSLINDYNNIMDEIDEFYFIVDPLIYEYKEDQNYLDLKKMGRIIYNQDYLLSREIFLYIYNEGMFLDMEYENYYKFNLELVSLSNMNYLSLKDYYLDNIYLPKESKEKVVSSRVIFKGIYDSPIDVYYDLYIDINYFVFNEEGRYKLVIEDE